MNAGPDEKRPAPAPAWFVTLARAGAVLIIILAAAYLYFFSSR